MLWYWQLLKFLCLMTIANLLSRITFHVLSPIFYYQNHLLYEFLAILYVYRIATRNTLPSVYSNILFLKWIGRKSHMLMQIVLTGTNINHCTLSLLPTKKRPMSDTFFCFMVWLNHIFPTTFYSKKFQSDINYKNRLMNSCMSFTQIHHRLLHLLYLSKGYTFNAVLQQLM